MTTATTLSPTLHESQLLGQTVVVVGGSSGIGLETARRARVEGAGGVLTGHYPERLQQAALEKGGEWKGGLGERRTGLRGSSLPTAEPFAPEAFYKMKIDTDGDAIADIACSVRFPPTGTAEVGVKLRDADPGRECAKELA